MALIIKGVIQHNVNILCPAAGLHLFVSEWIMKTIELTVNTVCARKVSGWVNCYCVKV